MNDRNGRDGKRSRGDGAPDRGSVQKLFDRLPPHSLEAEMSLLGSILLDYQVIADVLPLVRSADDFFSPKHGMLYRSILEIADKRQSLDLVQLQDELRSQGVMEEIGGDEYILQLVEAVPSSVNAPHYARIVGEKSKLRRLIEMAERAIYDAYSATTDSAREVLDVAESELFKIAEQDDSADAKELAELLQEEIDRLESLKGRGASGMPTGFSDLDEMLCGLQDGEMIIVAARPSVGKTALALNMAEQLSLGGNMSRARGGKTVPVGVFSLEMSKAALVQRLISARSQVSSEKLRAGTWTDQEFRKISAACGELAEAPVFIDDSANLSIMQLRARARRMYTRHHVRAIFIDYLQLLQAPGHSRESRQVEVGAISRGIKALARELSIPIVCLAQLNRAADLGGDRTRPKMSHLRESGSIEQDADVVMLLHREAYAHKDDPEWDPTSDEFNEENREKLNEAELIVAKQRNGPTGTVRLTWDEATTRFYTRATNRDSHAHHAPRHEPRPQARHESAMPEPKGFSPGQKTGPVADFRDGSGDRDWDDGIDDLPI